MVTLHFTEFFICHPETIVQNFQILNKKSTFPGNNISLIQNTGAKYLSEINNVHLL